MKRFARSILGVTLLEIMLVLAIAAMVIVMSVRYYQSAQTSSQVNMFLSQVQGITAAAESLAQGVGFTGLSATTVAGILPSSATAWNLPWGGTIGYNTTANGFSLSLGTAPANAVCTLIQGKFTGMTKYSIVGSCAGLVYDASK